MEEQNSKGGAVPPDCDSDRLSRIEAEVVEAKAEVDEARTELERAEGKLEHVVEGLERLEKTVTIVVDGTPYEVPRNEFITYAEVVTLAYPDYPQHPEITYSVTYTRGHSEKPEGILAPGGEVRVKEGMSFRVNRTGQS